MNHYVYETVNLINGKKYIGKRSCKCSIEEDKYLGSGVALNRAIKKYGKSNFSKNIIEVCKTENDAYEREFFWIRHFNCVKNTNYYNMKDGGKGSTQDDVLRMLNNLSPEQKKIRSEKLRIANSGKNNSMYGKTGQENPVSKAVVMISFEGDVVKEFDCIRDTNDYFNKPKSFSAVSSACLGKRGSIYGYFWLFKSDYKEMTENKTFNHWFEEMRERYVKRSINTNKSKDIKTSKKIYKLDKDSLEILEEYESIVVASSLTNISSNSIYRNCNHGCNTAFGYSWIFAEEYDKLTNNELTSLYSHKYKKPSKECFEKNKKPVVCLTTNDVFDGVVDAIKHFNLCKGAKIHSACTGERKTVGKHPETNEGLRWMYYDDYLKLEETICS